MASNTTRYSLLRSGEKTCHLLMDTPSPIGHDMEKGSPLDISLHRSMERIQTHNPRNIISTITSIHVLSGKEWIAIPIIQLSNHSPNPNKQSTTHSYWSTFTPISHNPQKIRIPPTPSWIRCLLSLVASRIAIFDQSTGCS
jgi:hypothetical protein